MNPFKAFYPGHPRFQETEVSLLLGWALLFPDKLSYDYFLGFAALLTLFTLCKLFVLKNVTLTAFSVFLLLFNAVFIFSAFFSLQPYKSLLFAGDVFLASLWFFFFHMEREDEGRLFLLAAWVISLSSLALVAAALLQGGRLPATPLFANPILQGIACALASLVFLHRLLEHFGRNDLLLLGLNLIGVIIAQSKAAFLGLAIFAALMILRRRKRWLPVFFGLLLLVALAPNPMRRMIVHSLRHDPYVLDRLDIWNMSARMFRRHPWTGVGTDLFADAAPRFNFPQEKGPSRFGKLPESPHSDFWKIISENGVAGLAFVIVFLFYAVRRLLSPPWFNLSKLLLAFLLVQMLLFNFVFNYFFLLVFFLLLRTFFPNQRRFVPLQPAARVFFSILPVFCLVLLYLFPFAADRLLKEAASEKSIVKGFHKLSQARRLSPLDGRIPLAKARILLAFSESRFDLAAWEDAMENARHAQKLNRYGVEALILESDLFRSAQARGRGYQALCEESLAPLRLAEKNDPFNPFIKMRQAVLLHEFGRRSEARERAQMALDLEPDFAVAIVFIHQLDGLPADDPALGQRLAGIRQKAERFRPQPDSYLFRLWQLPGKGSER